MPHFVITGGGNGIAAEIITGLAGKIGGKFTIIGRTVLPENIEQLSSLSEEQLEQKKLEIRDRLKKSGKWQHLSQLRGNLKNLKRLFRFIN
jgi:NAD(P)-dependent dehydrogenase (short-subunit alcohol dehydrogenase family)